VSLNFPSDNFSLTPADKGKTNTVASPSVRQSSKRELPRRKLDTRLAAPGSLVKPLSATALWLRSRTVTLMSLKKELHARVDEAGHISHFYHFISPSDDRQVTPLARVGLPSYPRALLLQVIGLYLIPA
jgi:hypothetical protein